MPVDPARVARALESLRTRIATAGGDPTRITIVAVTKGFGPDAVLAAHAAGLRDIGENYAQELVSKAGAVGPEISADVRWHFIGALQRNKVAALAAHVALWQTVDRLAAGRAIAARCPAARVLIEAGTGEPGRPGCPLDEIPALAGALGDAGLDVAGLMAVGPLGSPELARPLFRRVAELADGLGLPERSMGMTDDLEVAVEEGTTMVRIGRALFGPRPDRRGVPG